MTLTKRHFFLPSLATQCVPPAYLVADEVLREPKLIAAEEQLEPITKIEIVKITNASPRRNAPVPKGITNLMLKQLPIVIVERLCCLINSTVALGTFP
jgi:hypothetical protein